VAPSAGCLPPGGGVIRYTIARKPRGDALETDSFVDVSSLFFSGIALYRDRGPLRCPGTGLAGARIDAPRIDGSPFTDGTVNAGCDHGG
jgi:hypothetical protein